MSELSIHYGDLDNSPYFYSNSSRDPEWVFSDKYEGKKLCMEEVLEYRSLLLRYSLTYGEVLYELLEDPVKNRRDIQEMVINIQIIVSNLEGFDDFLKTVEQLPEATFEVELG